MANSKKRARLRSGRHIGDGRRSSAIVGAPSCLVIQILQLQHLSALLAHLGVCLLSSSSSPSAATKFAQTPNYTPQSLARERARAGRRPRARHHTKSDRRLIERAQQPLLFDRFLLPTIAAAAAVVAAADGNNISHCGCTIFVHMRAVAFCGLMLVKRRRRRRRRRRWRRWLAAVVAMRRRLRRRQANEAMRARAASYCVNRRSLAPAYVPDDVDRNLAA